MSKLGSTSRFAVALGIIIIALVGGFAVTASSGNDQASVLSPSLESSQDAGNGSDKGGLLYERSSEFEPDRMEITASNTLVISQAYGGGGGSTGTYIHDYVELKNISGTTQSLNGLSLYYGSATGQFASSAANAFALPNVNLNPGQYYLVQLGPAGPGGVALPVTPDAVTTNLTMSSTSGKVALVVTAGLGINICGAASTPCALPNANIIDLVAWGTSNNAEGGAATNGGTAITSTQGNVRKGGGCTDTDNNNADFDIVTAPVPRNAASPAVSCSGPPPPPPPGTVIVNSTADTNDGACTSIGTGNGCTLREAINEANLNADFSTINFNIPGAGVQMISPTSALPLITQPVFINGYTQPGASANTLASGNDAAIFIQIDGAGAGNSNGLSFAVGGSTLRGLSITRFQANGVAISNGATGNTIAGNFIGISADRISLNGNGCYGVYVDSANNDIGGILPADRNVISGNGCDAGIALLGTGSTGNRVRGNFVGTDVNGILDRGNTGNGITLSLGANGNTIGGTTAAARNVFSGNNGFGIRIVDSFTNNNTVKGNFIGTAVNGTSALGNSSYGVIIGGASISGNVIGGTNAGEGNIIANNGIHGVVVEFNGAINNSVRGNSIFNNGGLGIDLGLNGVTVNDTDDPDIGPNNRQNFPVLTSALPDGTGRLIGNLDSTASTTFGIDVFSNDSCDPSGNGEGQVYLGSFNTTTNSSGDALFDHTGIGLTAGKFITMTATDPNGNTSEFSQCRVATGPCASNPVVTNSNNSGPGSLRQAVIDACAGSTITFAPALTGTITLTSGEIAIDKNLTIQGPGAGTLTVSGNNTSRTFGVYGAINVNISGLSLTRGNGTGTVFGAEGAGGAIVSQGANLSITSTTLHNNTAEFSGGGIFHFGGTLSLANSTVHGNSVTGIGGEGGGIGSYTAASITNSSITGNSAQWGGGIEANGSVSIFDSTISGNTTTGSSGAIEVLSGLTTLRRSTVNNNTSGNGGGGGLYVFGGSNLVVESSTISGNSVSGATGAGAIRGAGGNVTINNSTLTNNTGATAGGIQQLAGTFTVRSSIIAGNTNPATVPDVTGPYTSQGFNLIGNVGTATGFSQPTDQTGTGASPLNPHLAPLGNYGGATATHALCTGTNAPSGCLAISPALDKGTQGIQTELQRVTIVGSAGTFTLTFNGQTTGPLAINANAATVQAALNALSSIGGVGGVATVVKAGNFLSVMFQGSFSGVNQPQMTAAGSGGATATVTTDANGGASVIDQRTFARPFDNPFVANAAGGDGSDIGAFESQLLTISGNFKQFVSGGPNTNLAGVTVTLSGSANSVATTDANGNFVFSTAAFGGNFVVTPSGLGKVYDPISRTYSNVTANITNANFTAYETSGTNSIRRYLRIVDLAEEPDEISRNENASPERSDGTVGTPVTLAIEAGSLGNETRFDFSLNADPAFVGIPTVTCGTDTPACTIVLNTQQPGRTGISVRNFGTLAAGTRQIARVTYPTLPGAPASIPVSFGDTPFARSIRDTQNNPVPANYLTGFISLGVNQEGDVLDENGATTGGDGVRANDVSLIRLFALRLATPVTTNNQYQRADCGPRDPATNTFGDGDTNVSDVAVARLYALGLLPPTPAAGPTVAAVVPTVTEPFDLFRSGDGVRRNLIIGASRVLDNGLIAVPVEFDSVGDGVIMSFSVDWDPAAFRLVETSAGKGMPQGAYLGTNTTAVEKGSIGVLLDAIAGLEGRREVFTLVFEPVAGAPSGEYPITLSDTIVPRNISSVTGELLTTGYACGKR